MMGLGKNNNHSVHAFIESIMKYSGLFLLIFHIILMAYYVYLHSFHMMVINTTSIIYYLIIILLKKNRVSVFSASIFFEIIAHMIIATLTFGMESGFQIWSFGLVCCFFLPTYSFSNKRRVTQSGLYAIAFMIAYFVLLALMQIYNIRFSEPIEPFVANQLFIINSFVSFVVIIAFTTLYASSSTKQYDELIKIANYDELTSLYNRHALNEISTGIIANANNLNKAYAVAIVDIDYFKKINDTYGHAIGDEVLKELSSIIRSDAIKGIIAGRWGGEEFVLISPSSIYYDEFIIILEKFREKIANTKIKVSNGKKITVTVSIGVFKIDNYKLSLEEAVALADDHLYEAKEIGRNKVIS